MKKYISILFLFCFFGGCVSQKNERVSLVLDTKSDLGEGALWNYKTGELVWVNITGKILNFYNPKLNNNKEMLTGQMIGCAVPAESGDMIIALEEGFYRFDTKTGSKKIIVNPEENLSDNRFNDGKCDPAGRFWAGTMNRKGKKHAGALYLLYAKGDVKKMIDSLSISNGIVWSNDDSVLYHIDTPEQTVVAWDYNNSTGDIVNKRVVVNIPKEMGAPDGMTIDEKGNLWIALWGGAAVGCWDPKTNELIKKINVPAKNVTSCAFGDDDLQTLYITTARQGTNKEELEKYPNAGGVFKVKTGVKGVKASFFKDEI